MREVLYYLRPRNLRYNRAQGTYSNNELRCATGTGARFLAVGRCRKHVDGPPPEILVHCARNHRPSSISPAIRTARSPRLGICSEYSATPRARARSPCMLIPKLCGGTAPCSLERYQTRTHPRRLRIGGRVHKPVRRSIALCPAPSLTRGGSDPSELAPPAPA